MITLHSDQQGISFLELLVVLVIIGILSTLAIPLFNNLITNYRLKTSVENLYQSLQYARSEAIKRNANVYVSFNTGDSWCYGISTGSACNCSVANNCNLGSTAYLAAQQLDLSTTGLNGTSVYFEGSHAAASASGTITFTKYGAASPLIQIQVNRLGNLQTCSTGISGYTAC